MLTSRLIACECRFQCLSVYCASPAAFFVSMCLCASYCTSVCAGIALARPSVWAELRKWAGRHVALCHLGPRVPITDGPLTLAQAWGQLRHHMERTRERDSWHSQPERMKDKQRDGRRTKTLYLCSGETSHGALIREIESGESQENGGFIPWNHRWDHLSSLAWINHIPGSFHAVLRSRFT